MKTSEHFAPLPKVLGDDYRRICDSAIFCDFTKTTGERPRGPAAALTKPGATDQEKMLAQLRYSDFRSLKDSECQRLIVEAAQRNDFDFFIALGNELKKPAISFDLLTSFLRDGWIQQQNGLPELCRLSGHGLAKVCQNKLNPELSVENVTKVRQRLGLIPSRNKKIQVELRRRRLTFFDPATLDKR